MTLLAILHLTSSLDKFQASKQSVYCIMLQLCKIVIHGFLLTLCFSQRKYSEVGKECKNAFCLNEKLKDQLG